MDTIWTIRETSIGRIIEDHLSYEDAKTKAIALASKGWMVEEIDSERKNIWVRSIED